MNYICKCPKLDFSKHNFTYWEDRDTTSDEIEIIDLNKSELFFLFLLLTDHKIGAKAETKAPTKTPCKSANLYTVEYSATSSSV